MSRRCVLALSLPLFASSACASDPSAGDESTSTSAGSDGSSTTGEPIPPQVDWPHVTCDPLVPSFCPLPFPSNVYTVADETTATGRRVQLEPDAMPMSYYGVRPDPTPWNRADGFTPGIAITAHFPELAPYGLVDMPSPNSIERSLAPDGPSVLLDAETGERVPHWVELDMLAEDPGQRLLIMHPAVRLEDGRRYIVSLSKLRDGAGDVIAPTPGFAALRDGTASDEPSIEARRGLYADIFARLQDAGVERASIQLAWDFTTASRENQTGWLLHMRDEALAAVGEDGPEYEITSVETDYEPDTIAYRIYGEMTVPMYLDQPGPGAKLRFGDDGMPEPDASAPTAAFEFELLIPQAALRSPVGLIQYGHGMLGEKEQIESEHFRVFMNEYGYAMFGVDFIGMAADDELPLGALIAAGEFHRFADVIDRQHQGMLNSLLAMRLMTRGFAADPDYGGLIDPSRAYYHGISQGGIFGTTYMALTTDVERGVLGVPGMPYNLLISRSADFDPFLEIMRATYPDPRQQTLLVSLADMLWERTEPAGYAPYVLRDMLPGTPAHQVLINDAIGDHQVTTLGAHVMARTMGMPHVDTGLRDIFGLELVQAPHDGSGIVEYGFGLPPEPLENLPQRACEDPHGKLRKLPEFQRQLDTFLRTGVITNECTDGVCSFPDMSGC
ncbi:MAG: hypothetical protein U0168_23180 [Nannocystaceae bacterium]